MTRVDLPLDVRAVALVLALAARHEGGLLLMPGDDRVEASLRHRVVLHAYGPVIVLALHQLLVRVFLVALAPEHVGAHVGVVDAHRVPAADDGPVDDRGFRRVDVPVELATGVEFIHLFVVVFLFVIV